MPKKLKLIICSPGGNITGLILNYIPLNKRKKISKELIKRNTYIEQIGYVTKSEDSTTLANLQMTGDEFCGNAVRSLAYIITQGLVPFVKPPKLPAKFLLKVSGASHSVNCFVRGQTVQIDIPLPTLTPIYQICGNYHIVHLEGISYVLVNSKKGNITRAHQILNERDFKPLLAVGVVYYNRSQHNVLTIEPYVFVKKTKILRPETSSGSSAVAVAIKEAYREKKSSVLYTIIPPSGIPIKTTVYRKGDVINNAYIKGPVKVLEIKQEIINY